MSQDHFMFCMREQTTSNDLATVSIREETTSNDLATYLHRKWLSRRFVQEGALARAGPWQGARFRGRRAVSHKIRVC